jgi:hypothetical protein
VTCSCIDQVREVLKVTGGRIKTSPVITKINGAQTIVEMPALEVYRLDNGKLESRTDRPVLFTPTFCPWCATRYLPLPETENQCPT